MKRMSIIRSVVVATSLVLAACEDGPIQTYNPSPPGSGNVWNNGHTPGSVDTNAKQGFVQQSGGTNKMEICSGDQKAARWADMVKQPIVPPTIGGGLDLSGGPSWIGLTIEAAEKINCQSDSQGDAFGDGTLVNSWGDNGELWIQYLVSNHKALQLSFWPGYLGTMNFKSKDGAHNYIVQVQSPVLRDGKAMILDWLGNGGKNFDPAGDELYRALLATYAPGLPVDPMGTTCFQSGHCIKGSFGDIAYFYVPAIGWALWVPSISAAQPVPSTPNRLDQSPAKLLPYAYARPSLKLDAEGPTATADTLGAAKVPCVLKLGLSYADFVSSCVQVDGNPAQNQIETNKLLGGLSHGNQTFHFDVQGVDIDYAFASLPPTAVVLDSDLPHATDISTQFVVDQSTLGGIVNDHAGNDVNSPRDLHGSGAVYKEFLRLARVTLLAEAGVPDGDPSKCLFPTPVPMGFDGKAFIAGLPAYCTGLEGGITAAPPAGKGDVNDVGPAVAQKLTPGYALGLKPGHPKVTYCMDANSDVDPVKGTINSGYKNCDLPYGQSGDIFATSYAQALKIFGKGKVSNMPPDVQDVRFFFKMYMRAMLKYFTVAETIPVPDLSQIEIIPDDLFFDSIGAGQFELCEYVDRRFASKGHPPTDIVVTADVRNGIFDSYDYTRFTKRGEAALYTAVLENQSDGLGQEDTALLTNIFGSPVIQNAYHASKQGKSAYYCGTTDDPMNCDGQRPPRDGKGNVILDSLNRPMLLPYKGAFANQGTPFSLGNTHFKVKQTLPAIAHVIIDISLTQDPYDPTSAEIPGIEKMVPWNPKQPGIGFSVAINGSLEKFISTYDADFSGTTISANVDYDDVLDANTHQPTGRYQILAVETTDFLGDVFVCQDPVSSDILTARMYTPAQNIVNWFASHPGSYNNCQMVFRYSPFGNFLDYITSLQNGVRLNITQGGGAGRVVDVTLFVPGQ